MNNIKKEESLAFEAPELIWFFYAVGCLFFIGPFPFRHIKFL